MERNPQLLLAAELAAAGFGADEEVLMPMPDLSSDDEADAETDREVEPLQILPRHFDVVFFDLVGTEARQPQCSAAEHEPASDMVARGHGIYMVQSFMQHGECDDLMSAAKEYISRTDLPSTPKVRLPIIKLSQAHDLCDHLVRRTLRLMEDQLPSLAMTLFGQAIELSDMDIRFSLNEPAVNVYQNGGSFDQHEDGHMLTILVPLSEPDQFQGGGTAFWPTPANAGPFSLELHDQNLLHVRDTIGEGQVFAPPRGTAMLFAGSVTHAGVHISSGERLVWVASFNLKPWKEGLGPNANRLLVSNTRTTAAQSLEEAQAMSDELASQQDFAYGGLRSDLRGDLAAAAAAATSDLDGRPHEAEQFEGLLDTLSRQRQHTRESSWPLEGSRWVQEVGTHVAVPMTSAAAAASQPAAAAMSAVLTPGAAIPGPSAYATSLDAAASPAAGSLAATTAVPGAAVAVTVTAAATAVVMAAAATTASTADLIADLSDPVASSALFAQTGVCVFESVLPRTLIDDCRIAFKMTSARVDTALGERGIGSNGSYFGYEVRFNEVCQRGRERLDIRTGMHDGPLGDTRLHGEGAPWMAFVHHVLGAGAHECFRGIMDSRPGSLAQEWHADGHEWDEALEGGPPSLEARRLTIFIPLVDLDDPSCGATQYYPGSHLVAVDHASKPACSMPTPERGSIIAFDYRTVHRGGANTRPPGAATRPMMHIVYARVNYDAQYETPKDRPLFASAGVLAAAPLPQPPTRLTVQSSEDLRSVLIKGTEGKIVLVPSGTSKMEPYTIAERSVHEMSMDVSGWLQRAIVQLLHEIPFDRLPPEAKEDALEQAARLKACLDLEEPFVVRLDDPTAKSWVSSPV